MNKACIKSGFCVDISFQLLWINVKVSNCWITCCMYVCFCKKLSNCLPKRLYDLYSPAMNEKSCDFPSLSAFGGVSVPDFDHSVSSVVIPCFINNLTFPVEYNMQHLFILICHLFYLLKCSYLLKSSAHFNMMFSYFDSKEDFLGVFWIIFSQLCVL